MTEAEWKSYLSPTPMLAFLKTEGMASPRKLRLFFCQCCRRVWHAFPDERARQAVEISEQFADGLVSRRKLDDARRTVKALPDTEHSVVGMGLVLAEFMAKVTKTWVHPQYQFDPASAAASIAYESAQRSRYRAMSKEEREQAALLRHIVGNPFQTPSPLTKLPADILKLADSLYSGVSCAYALRDALLDYGQPELAEHFCTAEHPKGCWALDQILGRS